MSGYGFANRLIYDAGSYKQEVFRSVQPMHYRLNPDPYYNTNNCQNRLLKVPSNPNVLIDVDSELSQRTRVLSNDNRADYPNCLGGQCLKNNGYNLSPHIDYTVCDRELLTPTNIKKNISNGLGKVNKPTF